MPELQERYILKVFMSWLYFIKCALKDLEDEDDERQTEMFQENERFQSSDAIFYRFLLLECCATL